MPVSLKNARLFEAVTFNMDGLLMDTGSLARRALAAAACSMGVEMPETLRNSLTDVPAGRSRPMPDGPDFPTRAYFESADRYMSEAIEAGELRPKRGVSELLT